VRNGGNERVAGAVFLFGLVGLSTLFLTVAFLPFQDLPNHELLLRMRRAIAHGTSHSYLREPSFSFAYSGYSILARALAPLIADHRIVRLLASAGAVGLPLSMCVLARSLRISVPWTGALSLCLAMSWAIKMGFVPYNLAIPIGLCGLAQAVTLSRGPRASRAAVTSMLFALTYLFHPLACAAVGVLTVSFWLVTARNRALFLTLAAASVPVLSMGLFDAATGAFGPIAGTEVTWGPLPLQFPAPGAAARNLLVGSFGRGPWELRPYAPLLAVLGWALYRAVVDRVRKEHLTHPALLTWFATSIACSLLAPSWGLTGLFGLRLATLPACFAVLLAATCLPSRTGAVKGFALAASLLATSMGATQIFTAARAVEEVVGRSPEQLSGRYLTVRVPSCDHKMSWDPLLHVWAYGVSATGVTPYVFAYNHYHPLAFDGKRYRRDLAAPHESVNEASLPLSAIECAALGQRRFDRVRDKARHFDGVIMVGKPSQLETAIALAGFFVERPLGPGILLARPQPGD